MDVDSEGGASGGARALPAPAGGLDDGSAGSAAAAPSGRVWGARLRTFRPLWRSMQLRKSTSKQAQSQSQSQPQPQPQPQAQSQGRQQRQAVAVAVETGEL